MDYKSNILEIGSKIKLEDALTVNKVSNYVGIGTISPGTKLHIGTGSGATVDTGYQAVIDSAGIAGLQILSATNQSGRIVFGDSDDNDIGMIKYDHTDNSMGFRTNGSGNERMRIDSLGNVGIGTTNPLDKLSVEGNSSNLLKIRNTTNAGGASIEFNDSSSGEAIQNGTITYYHSDSASQLGGASFWFEAEPDTVLVVGNSTNTGRIAVSSQNNSTRVDYGFSGDVNTGMYQAASAQVGLVAAGSEKLLINSLGVSVSNGSLIMSGGGDIRGNGQQLVLNAGESYSYATGQTAEWVYINAEQGLQINSSPDNWASGWAGRNTTTIGDTNGNSTFANDISVLGGDITLGGTGRIQGIDLVTADTDAANKLYVDNAITTATGDYLPLTAGLSYPLTGDLFIEGASTPTITLTDTTNNLEGRIRVADSYMYIEADDSNTVGATAILLKTDGVEALRLDANQDATFAGTIAVQGTGDSYFTGKVGIGITNPTPKLHIYQNDATTGTNAGITIEQNGSGDAKLQWLLSNVYRWVAGIDNSDSQKFKIGRGQDWSIGADLIIDTSGRVGMGTTTPSEKLDISGNIKVQENIIGSEAVSLIKDIITDAGYEDNAFYNPETINAYAGATNWASITVSNAYASDRTTLNNTISSAAFHAGGATWQPWFNVAEDEIVVEIDHTANALRYHTIVGVQFTNGNWRAKRIKIEAYNGTSWTTGLDVTDNAETTVAAKFNLSGAGVQKIKFTFGDPATSNGYLRVSKIFGVDYKGVSNATADASGTYYIEKYTSNSHYSNLYPGTDNTYYLGTSSRRYNTVYTTDVNAAGSITADQLLLPSYTASPANPTISFDSNTGGIWYESGGDVLYFRAASGNQAYVNSAGITSASNVYTGTSGQFRNYAGVWKATTGTAGGDAQFILNGKTIMHIDEADERVGIGTTSPSEELHISSENPGIRLQDDDGTDTFGRVHFTNTNLQFYSRNGTSNGVFTWYGSNGTTDTEHMRIDEDGNVGIGVTNPSVPLHVDGFARLNGGLQLNTTNAQIFQIQNSDLRFGTNNVERMRIDSIGNVGIGVTSPSTKLEVAGTINQTVLQNAPSDDLDNLDSTRFFATHTGTTNAPAGITSFGMGWTIAYATNQTVQFLTSRASSQPVYYRKQSNGTYSSWIRLRDENQISDTDISNWDAAYTYSQVGHLPLTGGTLSGDLTVNGGDIILGGTGRIQGIDTVTADTDAVNKLYVDTAVSGFVDGSGQAGWVAFWSDSDTITGENELHWDTSKKRLGIGGASPGPDLYVYGTTQTHKIYYDWAATDATYRGEIADFGNMQDPGPSEGDIVYLNSSGYWVAAQANNDGARNLLGFFDGTDVILRGPVTVGTGGGGNRIPAPTPTPTDGEPLYLSPDTAGGIWTLSNIDQTGYDTGEYTRIIGHIIDYSADSFYFNPDSTWVKNA